MADKPKALTTEQLLIELGRVVMGLGTKIDSLGQKLDSIHEVLSREKPAEAAEAVQPFSMDPLLEKLDSIHQAISAEKPADEGTPAEPVAAPIDLKPLLSKLDELKEAISAEAHETSGVSAETEKAVQIDIAPLTEKLDEIRAVVEKMGVTGEIKASVEGLAASVEKMPSTLMDGLEKRIDSIVVKLEKIQKASEDRKFVEKITDSVKKVQEGIEASGADLMKAVNEIPVKLDGMGGEIAGSMKTLKEKTGEVLDKAGKSLDKTEKTLEDVKKELKNGLKLNTDMTGQMVELTSKFADKTQKDQISELNSRAVEHFNKGEYNEADSLYKEALSLNPNNPELLCNSANVLAAMDDLKGAESLFRTALEESPELEPALSGLGLIMVKTNRAEETIEFLKSTILSGEPSVRTTVAYTRALASLDRHDEAVELLETALKSAPDNPDIREELAGYGYGEEK